MSRKFRVPLLAARDPEEAHRAATPLELLFDLISVIAIAAATEGLHHAISEGHGLEKLPVFAFVFTAIWWAWMNFTWFASAFDDDGWFYRALVMVIMTGELIFASGTAHIFKTLEISWGVVGWSIMRVAMAALWLRASLNAEYRTTALRYAAGIAVAQAYWIALVFVAEPGSAMFYAMAVGGFLIEFSVPPFAESARTTPFHRHHMIERYGLLVIISLGEIMLAISFGFATLFEGKLAWPAIVASLSGVIITFAAFWIYFCEREHLPSRAFMMAFVWGYAHVFVFAAVAMLGAAIAAEVDLATHHGHATQAAVSWWLGGAFAVFLAGLWVTRDMQFNLGHRTYALPAMAFASLLAGAAAAPSWVFAIVALAALAWRVPMRDTAQAVSSH